MRIVDLKTFLSLPVPVVFARLDGDDNIGELEIANEMMPSDDEVYAGDFYTVHLDWPVEELVDAGLGGHSYFDVAVERMKTTGESRDLKSTSSRDGCFETEQLFVIYEPADLRMIKGYLADAIEVQRPARSASFTYEIVDTGETVTRVYP